MKFTTLWLSTAALFTSIQAARIKRDNPTSTLLSLLSEKLTTLDTAISSYTGDDDDDADVSPIQTASNALIITIDRGMRDISAGPDLSSPETQALSSQLEVLATSSQRTISALVEKIPLFASTSSSSSSSSICNSASSSITKSLHNQYAVWDKLFTLISSKVPEKQAGFVAGFADRILASTQEGFDAYANLTDSSSNCSPAPPPPARIELRSYSGSGNSSSGGNTTTTPTTTTTATPSSQSTVPASPGFTGAAVALAVGDGAMKMVGMGALAVAVAVAL